MKELLEILDLLHADPAAATALATLVRVDGSSYRRPGARLLLAADGRCAGSISGGCLEDDVAAHASEVRAGGAARTVTYDTTTENDQVWGVGLGCHGVVHVLVERLSGLPAWARVLRENLRRRVPTELAVVWGETAAARGTYLAGDLPGLPDAAIFRQLVAPPPALVIFGTGNDARPLVRFARELGWHVTVVDPRPAMATVTRFPEADSVVVARPEEAAARVAPAPDALVVIMTHHYAHDLPLLRHLLARPLAYLGLLGPRARAERILRELDAGGLPVTAEMRARLHAPVGLDLGAETAEAVALSILAEMQAVLAGRDARPLQQRTAPIHG